MCGERALLQARSCHRGKKPGSRNGGIVDMCSWPSQGCALDSQEDPCDLVGSLGPISCLFVPREDHTPAMHVVPSFVPSSLPPTLWQSKSRASSQTEPGITALESRPGHRSPFPWARSILYPVTGFIPHQSAAVLRSLPSLRRLWFPTLPRHSS